jgi:outer membrane biosynthesis protein TonB
MRAAVSYHYAVPPWSVSQAEERRFRRILLVVLVLSMGAGLVMPWLPRPPEDREAQAVLPPQYAKMLLEHEPLVLPPPKKEPVKPEQDKPDTPDHAASQTDHPVPDRAAQRLDAARRKAASSGLLAMKDDLADLRGGESAPSLNQAIRQGPGAGSGPVTSGAVSRAMITAGAATGSGGIATSSYSANLGGGGGGLAARNTTRMPLATGNGSKGGQVAAGSGSSGKAVRSLEEIRLVMERNKAAIYAIYNRALRDDPSLSGKVVVQLRIAPGGEVLDCRLASTEIHSPDFERKLLARIRQFDFGSRDVSVMELTYPLDFLPS